MKKFARIFALALVCVLSVVALTACGNTPNTDIDKAKANLENKKYSVSVVKKGDTLSIAQFEATALEIGCKASDIEATLEAYKGDEDDLDNLSMVWFTSEDVAKSVCEKNEKQIEASKKSLNSMIEGLEAALELLPEDSREELEAQLKEAKAQIDRMDDIVFGYTGKVFFAGSKSAISATK